MFDRSKRGPGVRFGPVLLALLVVVGCAGGDAPEAASGEMSGDEVPMEEFTLAYGGEVPLGNGTMRTYVVLGADGPTEVGVALSEAALDDLPEDGAEGGVMMPNGHSTFPMPLAMPASNPTPFVHAVVDWNPAGHDMPGVYDIPHFDFHFFTIGPEVVMAIDPADPAFVDKALNAPPATHIPAGYEMPDLPPVPFMGAHWVDPTSPELRPENPETFTHTFIYGSWDGDLTFAEPMITLDFIRSREAVQQPVAVAAVYDPAGYYPTSYSIGFDEAAGEYRIALTGLSMME